MKKLKIFLILSLPLLLTAINYLKNENIFIDKYYSNGLYLYISEKLRLFTYWINIPIGDLFYLLCFLLVFYFSLIKSKTIRLKLLNVGSLIFILTLLFYVLWGFNYKRITIKNHLAIEGGFEKQELVDFSKKLIDKINKKHIELFLNQTLKPVNNYSFSENVKISAKNIQNLETLFGDSIIRYKYKYPSVKKSLFSLPLTYMGFSGYINPFTNEANINYNIPASSQVFVINHEIAHQLGIASEKDANFISFVMLINSDNEYHKYCGLSYALRLCLSEVSKIDMDQYKKLIGQVNEGIIQDYIDINKFWKKYDGNIESISKKTYDIYLKQNNIDSGIKNYNESISLILNYKFL